MAHTIDELTTNAVQLRSKGKIDGVWTEVVVTRYYANHTTVREKSHRVDFGLTDSKGRRIGYYVTIDRVTFSPATDVQMSHLHPRAGLYQLEDFDLVWWADTIATRNGERYGASTNTIKAKTRAELEKLITRRTNAARKRYEKTAHLPID